MRPPPVGGGGESPRAPGSVDGLSRTFAPVGRGGSVRVKLCLLRRPVDLLPGCVGRRWCARKAQSGRKGPPARGAERCEVRGVGKARVEIEAPRRRSTGGSMKKHCAGPGEFNFDGNQWVGVPPSPVMHRNRRRSYGNCWMHLGARPLSLRLAMRHVGSLGSSCGPHGRDFRDAVG